MKSYASELTDAFFGNRVRLLDHFLFSTDRRMDWDIPDREILARTCFDYRGVDRVVPFALVLMIQRLHSDDNNSNHASYGEPSWLHRALYDILRTNELSRRRLLHPTTTTAD